MSPWVETDIGHALTLPSDWYTSRELFELEQEHLFRKTWQYVGLAEEVAEPGDFFTCELGGEQLVITRDKQGELHALSNVCRHRAGPVATGCGRRGGLKCAYHGWAYELDGRLRAAKGMEGTPGFDPSEHRLPEFRVDTWGPQVWVSLDREISPLTEWLAPISERAANYQLTELDFAGGRIWHVPCNWKLYVDNYMEGYHVPFIHPGLNQATTLVGHDQDVGLRFHAWGNEQWGGEPYPRGPGSRVAGMLGSVSDFRKMKPAMPGLAETENNGYYLHWLFPNHTFNFMPDGFMLMRIRPLDVELTESTFLWWLPHAESLEDKLLQAAVVNFGHLINMEDSEICAHAQKGMRSRGYSQGSYNADEEGNLHQFHTLLARFMDPHLNGAVVRDPGH